MKKKDVFPAALIFTQNELALLLNTKRSQWVMYLHGQRDLSSKSKLNLASLIANVCELSVVENLENNELALLWENMLKENRYNQLRIQKKLLKISSLYEAARNTLCLISNLKNNTELFIVHQSLLSLVQMRANRIMQKYNLKSQVLLKTKWDILKEEEKMLLTKLKNIEFISNVKY